VIIISIMEVKVKIELINDGFLIYSPIGVEFRENLVDAVKQAVDLLEDFSLENFRIPFCDVDTEDLREYLDTKRKVWKKWLNAKIRLEKNEKDAGAQADLEEIKQGI